MPTYVRICTSRKSDITINKMKDFSTVPYGIQLIYTYVPVHLLVSLYTGNVIILLPVRYGTEISTYVGKLMIDFDIDLHFLPRGSNL